MDLAFCYQISLDADQLYHYRSFCVWSAYSLVGSLLVVQVVVQVDFLAILCIIIYIICMIGCCYVVACC